MLQEKLHLLEDKVGALIDQLREMKSENQALRKDLDAMRAEAEKVPSLQAENTELKTKLDEMRNTLSHNDSREQEIRERLRSIIEKIDAMEDLDLGE